VDFLSGGTLLGVGALDGHGRATFTLMTLPGGNSPIQAVYSGDHDYRSSRSAVLTETVNADPATITNLSASPSGPVYGQSVTFTATVMALPPAFGFPTGTVTFKDGSTTLGTSTLNSSTQATFTTSTLSVASHSITATYNGDSNFTSSTSSTLTEVVGQTSSHTTLASSANPAVFGQTVTFMATVGAVSPGAGTPSGTVTFKDGGTTLGTGSLNASGQATFSISTLALGTHASITASYGGDGNFQTSTSSTLSQVVGMADSSTALTASTNPALIGASVTFTATVSAASPASGTPTGTVLFQDNGATIDTETLNSSGVATFTTSTLSLGTHPITAVYEGDTDFNPSTSSTLSDAVNNPVPSITSLSPNSATEGDSGFTLTLTGQDFLSTSVVQVNGQGVSTSFVRSTQLTIFVTTADLAEEGSLSLTVVNPTPGGGTSNTQTVSVADAALTAGTLSAPSPTEGVALSSVTLFHFTDADPNAAASDYTATITWGDGHISTVTSAASADGQIVAHSGGFDVLGSHTYTDEATGLTFSVAVADTGGSTTSASASINVADAPPQAVNDSYTVLHDSLLIADGSNSNAASVLANDSDYDSSTLTAALVTGSGPAHGTLSFVLHFPTKPNTRRKAIIRPCCV
jgi:hypothetical protein